MLKKDKETSKKKKEDLSRPTTPSLKEENPRKRAKTDGLPPPPSAAKVVRELEKQRKTARQSSASPPPNQIRVASASPPPRTPLPIVVEETPQGLITENDLIQFMKNTTCPVTVKQVVTGIKPLLAKDTRNPDRLRVIVKKILNHEKGTGIVTLKSEYQ